MVRHSYAPRPLTVFTGHQHYSKLPHLTVLQLPSPAAWFLVALTESVDTLQPQLGFCGWSQWLSAESAIIPTSCHVFSCKLHSSRVLFSLGILHNLYLFAQCQLDVCFSAWTIFSFQNILHFREVFEQLFWEEIRQSISTQKLSYLLFLFSLWGHPWPVLEWLRLVPKVRLVELMEIGWVWQHTAMHTPAHSFSLKKDFHQMPREGMWIKLNYQKTCRFFVVVVTGTVVCL